MAPEVKEVREMRVQITITQETETTDQDKFLRAALERMAWEVGSPDDERLVRDTFVARAKSPPEEGSILTVELL